MAKAKRMEGISQLPEPIIHHILSFLTTKEAVKTSILSKSWLNIWRTRPTLELNDAFFFPKESKDRNIFRWYYSEDEMRRYKEFSAYVEQSLQRYREQNIFVDTLTLTFRCLFRDGKYLVKRCTELALEYGVRNFDLRIFFRDGELPQIVLETESLRGLYIGNCELRLQATEEIRCQRLKRLQLFRVSLDEVMLQNVISRCPLIELLQISGCLGLGNIKVTQVRNLKQFIVDIFMYQRIEVEAPNLELLSCSNGHDYSRDHKRIYTTLTLHTPQYQNLKNLELCGIVIYDNFFINLAKKFPQLEDLSIENCHDLQRIKLSSHSLKRIRLHRNLGLVEAKFDVPRIVRFEYGSCNFERLLLLPVLQQLAPLPPPPLPSLSFTATSGHWISNIYIHNGNTDMDVSWFLRMMGFLKNLRQSEISLTMDFQDFTMAFDINEFRSSVMLVIDESIDEINSGVVELQRFSIYFDATKFPTSSIYSIVDVMFLICHPKTVGQYWPIDFSENKIAKSLYDQMLMVMMKMKNEEEFNNLQQIKIWQHYLINEAEFMVFQDDVCVIIQKLGGRDDHHQQQYSENMDWDDQQQQYPETIYWDDVVKMLGIDDHMMWKTKICIMLEWKTPNMSSTYKLMQR